MKKAKVLNYILKLNTKIEKLRKKLKRRENLINSLNKELDTAYTKIDELTVSEPIEHNEADFDICVPLIVEAVMRRIYKHIFTNCGFDSGYFRKPEAVLDEIDISDIPGSSKVISHMDIFNDEGTFIPSVKVMGKISGLITKTHMPTYKLYINFRGISTKYIITAQNPDKRSPNGDLTLWAKQARQGIKIMMLLHEDRGLSAHMKADPDQHLMDADFMYNKI